MKPIRSFSRELLANFISGMAVLLAVGGLVWLSQFLVR
jgi:hypothetical protein